MTFSTRSLALLTTIVAVAASACSARDAQPATAPVASLECGGGIVRTDADAARFAGCETIVGDLYIAGSSLTDVSAFKSVHHVSGKLSVTDNARLISLAGLKHVTSARSVEIRNNPMLAAYPGLLPSLEQVADGVVLESNRGISPRETRAVLDRIEVRVDQVTTNTTAAGQRLN